MLFQLLQLELKKKKKKLQMNYWMVKKSAEPEVISKGKQEEDTEG